MTASAERKLSKIISIVYITMILGLSYLFIKYCLGIVFPFVFAFFVAMIVQKPTNACYKKIGKGKGIISTFFALLLILLVVAFISLVGAQIVSSCRDFVAYISRRLQDFPTFIDNVERWTRNAISFLPDGIEAKLGAKAYNALERFKDLTASEAAGTLVQYASSNEKFDISSILTPIGGGVWSVLKEIPSILVTAVISIVAACFMSADYDLLVGFLKKQVKKSHSIALSRSKAILFSTLRQLLKAYGTIMFITFSELSLGFYILKWVGVYKSGYIFVLAAIIAIVDIVPVLGTGTILLPWAVYSLINNNISLAIGILIIYIVILVIRQVIEPKLVADRLGLPPVLTIAAMYIGTQLFGFIGLFLLPIILITIKRLNDEGVIHLWKPSESEEELDIQPQEAEIQVTEENN